MEIVSLVDAKAAGLKKYFTGEPCVRGHIAVRRVDTRACWECYKIHLQLWRDSNRDKVRTLDRESRERRSETRLAKKRIASKLDYQKRPELYAEKCKKRRIHRGLACPPWADRKAMQAIYREASQLSKLSGIPCEVDHIVPLRHPRVCGLHVQNNLQILTKTENRKKWNTHHE